MRVLIAGEVSGDLQSYRREVETYVGRVDFVVATGRGFWRRVPLFIAYALRSREVVATSFLWFFSLFRPVVYVFWGIWCRPRIGVIGSSGEVKWLV